MICYDFYKNYSNRRLKRNVLLKTMLLLIYEQKMQQKLRKKVYQNTVEKYLKNFDPRLISKTQILSRFTFINNKSLARVALS